MKKLFLPFFGILILGLSSCTVGGSNIQYYGITPAIVDYDYETLQHLIITPYGAYFAPELRSAMLADGSPIVTSFSVDFDNQPYTEHYTVSQIQWAQIDESYAYATENGQSSSSHYNTPIEDMSIYCMFSVYNIMFVIFQHTAPDDQFFIYEMTYSKDITIGHDAALYIRAQKAGSSSSSSSSTNQYIYAFRMNDFFNDIKDSKNKVRFKIMYKVGEDAEGNDTYKEYVDSNYGSTIEIQVE